MAIANSAAEVGGVMWICSASSCLIVRDFLHALLGPLVSSCFFFVFAAFVHFVQGELLLLNLDSVTDDGKACVTGINRSVIAPR